MKCQILFSRKNTKDINNSLSAESAHNMVSVKGNGILDTLLGEATLFVCLPFVMGSALIFPHRADPFSEGA